jgi:hypothetical protein
MINSERGRHRTDARLEYRREGVNEQGESKGCSRAALETEGE